MKYWVIKGSPRSNDWDNMLKPGDTGLWHSYRIPKPLARGDRVFFWESSPKLRVIAIGQVVDELVRRNADGLGIYGVRYLTRRFHDMPGIERLRRMRDLADVSFLKAGPATGIFPLTQTQGQLLLRLLRSGNPSARQVWTDVAGVAGLRDFEIALEEGQERLVQHSVRERRPELRATAKELCIKRHGRLVCSACGRDFVRLYGGHAEACFEAHHEVPLARRGSPRKTSSAELHVLCANCHRVIHHHDPMPTVRRFRKLLAEQRRSTHGRAVRKAA